MKQHGLGFLYLFLGGTIYLIAVGLESLVGLSISVALLVGSLLYFVFSSLKKQEELAHQLEIQRKWNLLLLYSNLIRRENGGFIVVNLSVLPLSWNGSPIYGLDDAFHLQQESYVAGFNFAGEEGITSGDIVIVWDINKSENIFDTLNSQLINRYPMLMYPDVRIRFQDPNRGLAIGVVQMR